MQIPNMMDMFPAAKKDGGAPKKSKKAPKVAKKASKASKAPKKAESTKPKRTTQKIVGSDGKPHTVYKKDGVSFFRKKSAKTGKFYYSRVSK